MRAITGMTFNKIALRKKYMEEYLHLTPMYTTILTRLKETLPILNMKSLQQSGMKVTHTLKEKAMSAHVI